jgi:hypothetical protein
VLVNTPAIDYDASEEISAEDQLARKLVAAKSKYADNRADPDGWARAWSLVVVEFPLAATD